MKTLVIAHVFYPQLWSELAECIRNVGEPKDVVITYIDETAVAQARCDFPSAKFIPCANRGYDVGPFLKALQASDLSAYDLVVKLHTKRDIVCPWWKVVGYARLNGGAWRDHLLAFVKTPDAWKRTWTRFRDPSIGMVADRHVILTRRDAKKGEYVETFDAAVRELNEKFGIPADGRGRFVGGTMFAVRAALLRPFAAEVLAPDAFVASAGHEIETRAHVFERIFGLAVGGQGLSVEGFDGSFRWWRIAHAIGKFIWDSRLTERRRSVRICGITVYIKHLQEVSE